VFIISAAITLAFQVFASNQYGEKSLWMIVAGVLFVVGSLLMIVVRRTAYVMLLAAMLVIPAYWTVMTTVSNANINLPTAYTGNNQQAGPDGLRARSQYDGGTSNVNEELVAYLQENTQNIKYLVAVPSSQQGASLVLATGRPVLYMGGFHGQDDVVSVDDLREMTQNDDLLYVLYGGDSDQKQDVANWLESSCFVIQQFSNISTGGPHPAQGLTDQQAGQSQNTSGPGPGNQRTSLYMCH
jgi:hypothetical protein